MATDNSPEAAVRLYLMHLEDPSKLVDQTAVTRAQAAVDKARDPIAKLHAIADLQAAKDPDSSELTRNFIAQAKAYADSESIPVSAFQQLGVPNEILVQAGFGVARGIRARKAASSGSASAATRAPRVPLDQIKSAISRLPKRFVLTDLAEKAGGGSPATLRKAVDELISEDKVKKVGPMENYSGRGRAPTVYELA